jgi:hypothetical protein
LYALRKPFLLIFAAVVERKLILLLEVMGGK